MNKTSISDDIKLYNAQRTEFLLNNLPLKATREEIAFDKNTIFIKNIKGYYGSNSGNIIVADGTVRDYTNSADTQIKVTGTATNDLMKNYLSKVVGYPLTLE